ncbi:helix-turn-helix domain-containing protein [Agaribacterium sp. ZY112]|uniref:helix-turn-helix domain-containing protein n=1 Tax=Agaribacterium sp. ZY112 TaxID=3233574 RepID=UPI0035248CE5
MGGYDLIKEGGGILNDRKRYGLALKVALYVEGNFSKKITLKSLSIQFCTNRTTLSSSFRERYKVSVYKYLTKVRMDYARAKLVSNDFIGMDELAESSGYSDRNNFSTAFKRENGVCPISYMKLCNNIVDIK